MVSQRCSPNTLCLDRKYSYNSNANITIGSYPFNTTNTYTIKAWTSTFNGIYPDANHSNDTSTLKNITFIAKPASGFTINNNSQCLRGNSFVFTNTSTGSITSKWSFGDLATTTLTSPSHSYTSAGNYNAKLVITSTIGCGQDSMTKALTVNPQTNVAFTTVDTRMFKH